MTTELILAGCGNMGYAMLAGWISSGHLAAKDVIVVEPAEALRERASKLGVTVHADASEIAGNVAPRLVILAVKPQIITDVTPAYARFKESATYVSVAAGTTISTFETLLGNDARIIRCMPNTPASIGKGMMVVVSNGNVDDATNAFVKDLLTVSGAVATVDDESQMDAVTAVSGSGPGYVFHFIEALTAAAESAGLPADTAKLLAIQTVFGAASLAVESPDEPGELRRQVTSPNGTTAAGLSVLMTDERLTRLVTEAVDAAKTRSIELGK